MRNKHYVFMHMVALLMLMLAPFTKSRAQEDGLVMHYDFKEVSGTQVSDASGNRLYAELKNEAHITDMGKYKALNLGNGTGYLDMTASAGTVFQGLDTYSISMYYRVDELASVTGAGFFLWAFADNQACEASVGKYSAYRLNAQRFASTTGGYSNEKGFQIGTETKKGSWIHIVYVQSGTVGRLYLDGVQKGTATDIPTNSSNFTGGVPYAWIGRAPFSADSYLKNTLVGDIRLYNRALTSVEITTLAALAEDWEYQYKYGSVGDFTALKNAIDEGNALIETGSADFPKAAIDEYKDALTLAQTMVAENKVSQLYIDKQLTALETAKSKFMSTKGFKWDDTGCTAGYDANRGFKHPGGLHTQADFDRIKAQLAAGNSKVSQAMNVLRRAEFAQSTCATWPVETIIRGEGAQNYINAARGATIAYQNALRWKIDGSREHAAHAVQVLMQWANVCKLVSGNSNYALAAGIYGYEFAQAAELVRDYDGWKKEDFESFKRWMLDVWYPPAIGFLRGRNGTWENAGNKPGAGWGDAGNRPGHYWSNWGLCNALCVMSIGVLCDDVFIYNQGLSFYKYDHVGTFIDPRGDVVTNDGLTEFLGNLVVDVHEDERGAYGYLGQMQESGRDQGHATMAAGLAVDICQVAWNQGDDLYSYMNNRLAAGIEYVAAYNNAGVAAADLPWTTYRYADCRTAWHAAWQQGGIGGGPMGARPYWARVIGHYEGVKGVKMPYSEVALEQMGIDDGGTGGTSGDYDHLGYSVLTCTHNGMATDETKPTLLTPQMTYNGQTINHNELGGLKSTFVVDTKLGFDEDVDVTLTPVLPEGEENTGKWKWNTGETTQSITVNSGKSYVYRATYTNAHGVESEQVFTIASLGDCTESSIYCYTTTTDGVRREGNTAKVKYGESVTLEIYGKTGWGTYLWENGQTASYITIPNVTSNRDISGIFTSQGGRKHKATFHIELVGVQPNIEINGKLKQDTLIAIVDAGSNVVLRPEPAANLSFGTWKWDDGSEADSLCLENVTTSSTHQVTYDLGSQGSYSFTYHVYVPTGENATINEGNYMLRHAPSGMYLTNPGDDSPLSFKAQDENNKNAQVWTLTPSTGERFSAKSLLDGRTITSKGALGTSKLAVLLATTAVGTKLVAMRNFISTGNVYWQIFSDGSISFQATPTENDFNVELIHVGPTSVGCIAETQQVLRIVNERYVSPAGQILSAPQKGLNIKLTTYADGSVKSEKVLFK